MTKSSLKCLGEACKNTAFWSPSQLQIIEHIRGNWGRYVSLMLHIFFLVHVHSVHVNYLLCMWFSWFACTNAYIFLRGEIEHQNERISFDVYVHYFTYRCTVLFSFLFFKFSFLFHLKNHHSKDVNLKFWLKQSSRLDTCTKQFCYNVVAYILLCKLIIMVTITRHVFINILQTKHFTTVKFAMGYEKNILRQSKHFDS